MSVLPWRASGVYRDPSRCLNHRETRRRIRVPAAAARASISAVEYSPDVALAGAERASAVAQWCGDWLTAKSGDSGTTRAELTLTTCSSTVLVHKRPVKALDCAEGSHSRSGPRAVPEDAVHSPCPAHRTAS